jgi:Fe2+ transport protein
MINSIRLRRVIRRGGAVVAAGVLVAGCAAADKNAPASASSGGSSSSSMPGMDMGSGAGTVAAVNGIKPIPSQLLATTTWQGMRIEARTMTAVPFVIFNGQSEQTVKPPKGTNFHLMVMLNDAHTNEPIPYASVWATFTKDGKVIYDERQWPMLSAFMGPHYGNNVQLAGAGKYKLTLLITPPVSARHMEYKNVWLTPHRVSVAFNWKPPTT